MDALNPPPAPDPTPDVPGLVPAPEPAPAPAGPACTACGTTAVVQWQRRPSDEEIAAAITAEESRRDYARLMADPQASEPDFGPLPTGDDMTIAVYACGQHAISLDAAARVHTSSCTAPNDADLPACDCTPESLPQPEPADESTPAPALPAHWLPGAE
ncbi:hypothetical protein [Streptomyces sp. NPDC058424]|uniref:hypothetical protein n=1 Tax=Streptomyces sp. NPDC058424 TaxID=3346491 RepID=UPI00364725BC